MNFLNFARPGFSIFGLEVTWYGFIMASSMAIATILCMLLAKRRGLKGDDFIAPALWILPLAILGARTMYVLFPPEGINSFTFVEFLKIWEGGMSIWGGILGGTIGLSLYCLIRKRNILSYGDVIVPGLILAQSIGRWGNFLNQEAYGWEITNPKYFGLPYSVFIESEGAWHMATFLYEASLNLLGFIALLIILLKTKKRGLVTAIYLMIYGTVRSAIEVFRTDPLMVGAIKMSQLLSIIATSIGLALLIYIIIRDIKLKKKGIDPYSFQNNSTKKTKNIKNAKTINKKNDNKTKTKKLESKRRTNNKTSSVNKNNKTKEIKDKGKVDKKNIKLNKNKTKKDNK